MQLHIYKNADVLNKIFADWLVNYINTTLQVQDKFSIVLSGGNTPQKLNELLASENYKNKIDWRKLHFFWGDERFVSLNDERNNAKMAFDTLLNHIPVVKENIHIIPTENITPEASAQQYENVIQQYFQQHYSSFDLVLLGMGNDGHTLSLFPHQPVIYENKKWVTSFWLLSQNMYRITLTALIVNKAKCITFLVTGTDKASALKEVLEGEKNIDLYPSQIIQPTQGALHWFVDEAAAGLLNSHK
ncbi:MAG: 6-phosphogluconolactonase [Bacteroidetes bacterium]|nr:6-phosphogluconolactonase [Bacteroidota bacterium]MBS1649025.1 6-phosphogluconolactonase [Bacteroidota bacterium]